MGGNLIEIRLKNWYQECINSYTCMFHRTKQGENNKNQPNKIYITTRIDSKQQSFCFIVMFGIYAASQYIVSRLFNIYLWRCMCTTCNMFYCVSFNFVDLCSMFMICTVYTYMYKCCFVFSCSCVSYVKHILFDCFIVLLCIGLYDVKSNFED